MLCVAAVRNVMTSSSDRVHWQNVTGTASDISPTTLVVRCDCRFSQRYPWTASCVQAALCFGGHFCRCFEELTHPSSESDSLSNNMLLMVFCHVSFLPRSFTALKVCRLVPFVCDRQDTVTEGRGRHRRHLASVLPRITVPLTTKELQTVTIRDRTAEGDGDVMGHWLRETGERECS